MGVADRRTAVDFRLRSANGGSFFAKRRAAFVAGLAGCAPAATFARPDKGGAPTMKNLFHAGKFLFLDMASTFVFLGVLLASKNVMLATGAGMAFGLGQIGLQVARKRPLETIQWLSLFLVVTSGTATLLTHDPRFVMFKPTIIYAIVGAGVLQR